MTYVEHAYREIRDEIMRLRRQRFSQPVGTASSDKIDDRTRRLICRRHGLILAQYLELEAMARVE